MIESQNHIKNRIPTLNHPEENMENLIYSKLYNYLLEHPKKELFFGEVDMQTIKNIYKEAYCDEISVDFDRCKDEVRAAFLHFYYANGIKSQLIFKKDSLIFKKRVDNIQNNFYINMLIQNIKKVKYEILKDMDDDNFLILNSSHKDKILCEIESEIDDESIKKKIINISFKKGLALEPKDLVVTLNNKVIIRRFIKKSKDDIFNEDQFIEETIKKLPKNTFDALLESAHRLKVEEKIDAIAYEIAQNELHPKGCDNLTFTKSSLSLLNKKFLKFLFSNIPDEDISALKLFSAYLIKLNRTHAKLSFAKAILDNIVTNSHNQEAFFNYYNGEVAIDSKNKKRQKGILKDANGNRLSYISIVNSVNSKCKLEEELQKERDELKSLEKRLFENSRFKDSALHTIEVLEGSIKKRESNYYQNEIDKIELELKDAQRELFSQKDEELKSQFQNRVDKIRSKIDLLKSDEIRSHKLKDKIDSELATNKERLLELENERDEIEKLIEKQKRRVDDVQESYQPYKEKYDLFATNLSDVLFQV